MSKRIIRIVIIVLMVVLSFLLGVYSNAHSGNTDINGCHVCRTDCEQRGYSHNQSHCHTDDDSVTDATPLVTEVVSRETHQFPIWRIIISSLGIGGIIAVWIYGYKRK